MRRPLLFLALSLLVLPLAPGLQAQESVLLRIGGTPGQSARYQNVMEMWMRGGPMAGMGGDTSLPFMRRTAFVTRSVVGVSGDTITVNELTDSAHVETPANPQMAPMMQGAAGIGMQVTSKMNARGAIYSSENTTGMTAQQGAAMGANGPPQGPGGMSGMPGMGGRGGRGGRGGMGGMTRNQRTMFLLPEGPVRVGQSWTDTMIVVGSEPGEPSTTFAATYQLQRIDNSGGKRLAVVTVNGVMTMANPNGNASLMNVTGEFQLDTGARRLQTMAMQMNGNIQSPQGEMPVKMQMNQTLMP